MLSLNADKLAAMPIPIGTGWLLGACMEAKGKQDLWIRQRPEVIDALKEQTIIHSVESSNRIEGVTVDPGRLRPIVLGNAAPRTRSEEEIAGYKRALNWVFTRRTPVAVEPRAILRLHALAHGLPPGAKEGWKTRDNDIIEILPTGRHRVRFSPTPAKDAPAAVSELCANYRAALEDATMPPLLLAATFVFDFLCIHPLRDGNGRTSRLLTTLLLLNDDFLVARYVSLERLVEQSRDEYYAVLERCSNGWHEGTNEIVPWWNYFLGILKRGYGEFAEQVETAGRLPFKGQLVRSAVEQQAGPFTLADIKAECPAASVPLIKKVLSDLRAAGKVHLSGRGRSARWSRAGK